MFLLTHPRLLWVPGPQVAEQDPQPPQEVQTGHPFNQVHFPTLVEDPGHPVANWFVPGMTHRLFLLLWVPNPQVTEQDPQPPQEVQTGHPALLQFAVSEEAPEQLVDKTGFPSKIHCLDLDRIESLPHVFEHPDQLVHLLQVGQAGRVHTFTSVLFPTHLSLGCTV